MRYRTIRRQRPIKGGRDPLPSCVIHEINQAVTREAHIHRVSKSWIVAVALADFFGIKTQETFYPSKSGAQFPKVRSINEQT
jgi:hypothetical protein